MNAAMMFLALIWGALWASFLQFTQMGRFLAQKRTWITVVVGIGVDLLLLLPIIPFRIWTKIFTLISLSSLAIIFRSLWNEFGEILEVIRGFKSSPNS
jgi:hypothetical protein